VAVHQRVLWIGGEAYPVQNIARAQTIRVEPDRVRAAIRFAISAAVVALLAIAATIAGREVRNHSQSNLWVQQHGHQFGPTIALLAGVLLLLPLIRLLRILLRSTYYALVVETSGVPRTALTSRDPSLIGGIVQAIMNAVENPMITYNVRVKNLHAGDNYGDTFAGKVQGNITKTYGATG